MMEVCKRAERLETGTGSEESRSGEHRVSRSAELWGARMSMRGSQERLSGSWSGCLQTH